jgi:hypothetical protein
MCAPSRIYAGLIMTISLVWGLPMLEPRNIHPGEHMTAAMASTRVPTTVHGQSANLECWPG